MPKFRKIKDSVILYYYSSIKQREQLLQINEDLNLKDVYFDFLKLDHFLWFYKNLPYNRIITKKFFNQNANVFPKTTFLIFKLTVDPKPNKDMIREFVKSFQD